MKKIKFWKLAAMCLLALTLVMPAFVCTEAKAASNASIYRLASDRVRLRSAPTSAYNNIITVLSRGTRMIKLGSEGNWFKVITATGKTGWIFSKPYLSYYGAVSAGSVAVTSAKVRMRAQPKLSARTKKTLSKNTPIIVRQTNATWAKVQTLTGTTGYVKLDYVKYLRK